MEDKKLRPYADITVSTGKYMKDGRERNRYQKIGTLFATPHFSHMTIKLDALPVGDGWLSVFPRNQEQSVQQDKSSVGFDEVHENFDLHAREDIDY